jgi:2-polyprenyl-3-methyl-5-hydroxy-6-metoxy-1,4-benzoquinol methylase
MQSRGTEVGGLQERVDAMKPWHYAFDLDGVRTPIYRPDTINRHVQRRRIGLDPLVRLVGGLEGKRVLDLACNSGYWSLAALEAGAEFVFGIEGRQLHIDQAHLVFEHKGIDPSRYRFELGNLFDYDYGSFDVVLCLGFMYHTAKPMELFEIFDRVGASAVLIDTRVNLIPVPAFRIHWEPTDNPRHALDYETTLVPSRQAVLALGEQFGFEGACLAQPITDWEGMRDFKQRGRAMFLLSKGYSLGGIERERTDKLTLGVALARHASRRWRKRLLKR